MKIESKSTETEKSLLGSILSKVKDGARMTDAVFFGTTAGILGTLIAKEKGYLDHARTYIDQLSDLIAKNELLTTANLGITAATIFVVGAMGAMIYSEVHRDLDVDGPSLKDLKSGKYDIEQLREDRWVRKEMKRYEENNKRLIEQGEPPMHIYNIEEKLRSKYYHSNIASEPSERFRIEYDVQYKIWKNAQERAKIDAEAKAFARDIKEREKLKELLKLKMEAFEQNALAEIQLDMKELTQFYKDRMPKMVNGKPELLSGQITPEKGREYLKKKAEKDPAFYELLKEQGFDPLKKKESVLDFFKM